MSEEQDVRLKPLKWYKNLAEPRGRLEARAFLAEGERAISQIIAGHPHEVLEIVAVEEPPSNYIKYPARLVTESQYSYISPAKTPQGIMAVVRMPADILSGRLPANIGNRVLLLEDVQDPGNVGTLIRTAAALDFSGVILTEKCADPLSPKCVQSTAGAVLSLWLRRTGSYLGLLHELKVAGFYLVATDTNGNEDHSALISHEKLLLALGNEASGLSEALLKESDFRLRIPVNTRKVESLNVAACGAICMYLSSRKC